MKKEAKPCRSSDHTMPPEVIARWRSRIVELLQYRDDPKSAPVVKPTAEALSFLRQVEDQAADNRESGGKYCDIAAFAARLAENTWRLALVLHAVQQGLAAGAKPLSLATAQSAAKVAGWFFSETVALLSPMREARQMDRVERLEEIIHARGSGGRRMTVRDLVNRHGFKSAELEVLAQDYPARLRLVSTEPGPQGGRSSRRIELVPN